MGTITLKKEKDKPIGVMDSGLGGLTVLRDLEQLLPMENLVYFGDNANCPYGNRPKEEILELSITMLDFLRDKDVKIVAIACNTISTLIDELKERYEFKIVGIIDTACDYIASLKLEQVGIFATEFTVKQGHYERLMKNKCPQTKVFSRPSRNLAMLLEEGRFDNPLLVSEIQNLLTGAIEAAPQLNHIVLGCTHYPIVQDIFEETAPDITFINPAYVQANAVKTQLIESDLLSITDGDPKSYLDIYTSGEKRQYEPALKKLKINRPLAVHTHA